MTWRRLFALLGFALCTAALAGCDGDTLSLDPVASAANKTAEAESARITFRATVTAGAVGAMEMSGRGIFDGRTKTGWMRMDYTLPPAAKAQLGSGSPSMEMIFDGSDGIVMYMRSSMFDQLGAGKWLKLDLEGLADREGIDLGALMNANQADPNQTLRMLTASNGARVSGSDTIRGVKTTRYSFNVDLEKLADENEELSKSLEQLTGATGTHSFPAEAWIDDQDRVRRLKLAMRMSTPAMGSMTMTMVEDLYDFGVRAEIFPPAEADVIDISSLGG